LTLIIFDFIVILIIYISDLIIYKMLQLINFKIASNFVFSINMEIDPPPKIVDIEDEETTTVKVESELIASIKPNDEDEEFEEFPIYRASEGKLEIFLDLILKFRE
jgi:hypothetical protein